MKFNYALFSFLLFFTSNALADDDFTSFLDDMTDIATKTKLNIDYQPSVVSVLHADKLKKIGIRNVHEAIGLLPGIETSILHTGWKQVIFRGAYNPDTFVFDKYKLLIDGVDIGSDLYSTSYYYLDFPVELIDRIEVLRGSASTIYGPGAFSGAINIITKSTFTTDKDKVFASIGSYGYAKGGFVKHLNSGEWSIGIDSYYQRNNKELPTDSSYVSNREFDYTRSDYNSLESFRDFSIGITAKNKDFKLMGRYKSEVADNFYGMMEYLEPISGGYQHNQSAVIELENIYHINHDFSLQSKVGANYYAFTFDTTVYKDLLGTGTLMQLNPTYKELHSYIDVNFQGENVENHEWMIGVGVQKIDTLKNIYGTTLRTTTTGGPVFSTNSLVYLEGQYGLLDGDHDQWIKSLYFQDIYSLNSDFDLSFNARLDDYSLFKKMLSYRLGSVYRVNDNNIFKAVYGRSYRAPSYVEAFQAVQDGFKTGNPTLNPEVMDTYELAYTYKTYNTLLRANLFYSSMQDVIDKIDNEPASFPGDYANHQRRNSKGLEIEYTHQFENGMELMTNLSYVRTEFFTPDYTTPIEYRSPEISEVLSKGYLLNPLTQQFSLNSAWYYSGSKNGYDPSASGNSQVINATFVVDETLSYDIDYSSMLTISVKNLFDESVIYPSYNQIHSGIRREGRNWLVTYQKEF